MTASDLPQKPSAAPPDAPDSGSGRLTYEAVTADVRVTVRPVFLEEQSDPEEHQFLWAYHIRIENLGDKTVQLLSRHWRITDGLGQVHEVEGAGVVGEQPTLKPGGSFEYTSGAPLSTPSGFMGGDYRMRRDDGESLAVRVPTFSLDSPYADSRTLH
ncbi:MAG: Co2+/Mg2+ efflux protein ApaG [Alphaproteobacteria bacterium]|nr:Co2+/Mg2+ efflux protein ApaG [Alphaproteobacteria bacterium]MDA7983717.1 Co2+/Mg2+ efflux protein ApaG [Alphaproteobacteria bacterium]MDA7984946.1 Co2+/Mg2+ efflux protein ApaG [Alphaproteobacteria bacterium]MDA7987791.1 Co2+/Mg2+ efflux protein ApaG [Alphaproteobacteria bacterium]MDA7989338.1 Co2+/Mg2+ efflux protein ApaG [Alphaproteobacteria bacterium]